MLWAALLAVHLCALPRAAHAARAGLDVAAAAAPQPAGGAAAYAAVALLALAVLAALLALVGIKQGNGKKQGGQWDSRQLQAMPCRCAHRWYTSLPPHPCTLRPWQGQGQGCRQRLCNQRGGGS